MMDSIKTDQRPLPVPVLVLSGFLGAGKTTLLNRLLERSDGRRVACIVNDLGAVNVDASLLKQGSMKQVDAHLVEMQNGCICCTLRGDRLEEVARLAFGGFDYIVIESTGIGEPLAIAETFAFELEDGETLGDVAAIDAMVTLVDATTFLREWTAARTLEAVGQALGPEDERTIADLLVAQVEFANVLVISKADLASDDDLVELEGIVAALNPKASIVRATRGDVPMELIMDTDRFDLDEARAAPGWMASLHEDHKPETIEYGIASFVYRARRPFHPQRFWDWLNGEGRWDRVLRSKGFFWLATRHDRVGLWQQAGGAASCEVAGYWFAGVPETMWPDEPAERAYVMGLWQTPYGDRRQELVFIGQYLDEGAIRASLDACLLDDVEMASGPESWGALEDPFPAWDGATGEGDS